MKELKEGLDTLQAGGGQLTAGADTLSGGITTFADGSSKLKDGTAALAEGGKELESGASTLSDGAGELADGIKEFDEEAVGKLKETMDDEVQGLADRIKEVIHAGKDYQNFAGIREGAGGSVKFLIETDAIEAE